MTEIPFNRGAIKPAQCIGDGWQIIKGDYWTYFGIALIAWILTGCIPIVNLFLVGPVLGGVFYCLLRRMRGETVSFGEMFKGFDKFVPLMLAGLIQAIPGIVVQIVQTTGDLFRLVAIFADNNRRGSGSVFFAQSNAGEALFAGGMLIFALVFGLIFMFFAIAWAVTFQFVIPLIMEHNLGVFDAIKTSAKAGWSNFGGVFLLLILEGLVIFAGLLAFCLGVFFVLPIIYAANAVAYRQVFPISETFAQSAPPPPTDYGSDYGRPTGFGAV